MGREIRRVPLDFAFPIGESFANATSFEHCKTCPKGPAYEDGQLRENVAARFAPLRAQLAEIATLSASLHDAPTTTRASQAIRSIHAIATRGTR